MQETRQMQQLYEENTTALAQAVEVLSASLSAENAALEAQLKLVEPQMAATDEAVGPSKQGTAAPLFSSDSSASDSESEPDPVRYNCQCCCSACANRLNDLAGSAEHVKDYLDLMGSESSQHDSAGCRRRLTFRRTHS